MENVGTIAMDMDAVLLFTIDIAADMVPPFQDQALLAGLMHLVGKDTAKEAAADDDVIVHNLVPHFVINGLRDSLVRRPQVAVRRPQQAAVIPPLQTANSILQPAGQTRPGVRGYPFTGTPARRTYFRPGGRRGGWPVRRRRRQWSRSGSIRPKRCRHWRHRENRRQPSY